MSEKNNHCVFCKVIKKELPGTFYYESEKVVAINNIHPVTPVHVLIIPVRHVEEFFTMTDEDDLLMPEINKVTRKVIAQFGLGNKGYRIIINGGGANEIKHLHWHIMGPIDVRRNL